MISRFALAKASRLRISPRPFARYGIMRSTRGFSNIRKPVELSSIGGAFKLMLLQNGKTCVAQIRDQHRGRRMGDAEGRFRVFHRKLRREAARPEDGQFAVCDLGVSDILITPA